MRRKTSGIGLLVVVAMFLLVLEPIPVHAASSIVQQKNGGCVNCASTTLAVAFSSPVASGNVVVVGIEAFGGGGSSPATDVTSLGDSLGSSYTQAVTSSDGNNYVYIYYATLSSSGSDTVTATFGGIRTESAQNVYIYEVSGVVPTGAVVDNNAGSGPPGSSISTTNSVSFPPGAFLLGVIGIDDGHTYPSAGMTISPGAGFTLSSDNSGSGFSHAQYATSGVSSPTNFPATITNPSSNYYWAEASLALYNRDCCTTVTTTSSTSTTTTSSTSTTTTFASSTTSTVLPAITNSQVVTGTTSVTSTVTGPTAGTATTTYTSILSTSTTTSLVTSTVSETTTETGVTTVGTDTSTTTSTGTAFSSTTTGGTVMVTETDTVNVLFTTIFQELHQLADEFLQLIEVQPVATPVAQQVNQVIVTTTTTTSTSTVVTITSATGAGTVTFTMSPTTVGGFTSLTASALSSVPTAPPAGLTFPDGLFSFTISGLSPGATVTVTVTLSSPLPAGSFSYWKFQSGAWSQFSSASLDSTRTIITLTFTADASGTVTDPGGPVIVPPPSAGPVGGVVEPVNKLGVFAPYVALLGLVSAVTVVVAKPWKRREN